MTPVNYATLVGFPKIELHRHLEGSLRLATLFELAREHKLDVPTDNIEALRAHVQVIDEGGDYRTFLAKFLVLRKFFLSREVIQRLAHEAVADAAADNIRYLELRFTPMALAKTRHFALEDVTDWVIEAVNEAQRKLPILVRLIVSMNRNEGSDVGERAVKVAIANKGRGVVAVDLAGDEVNYSAESFVPLFESVRAAGLGVTIHAGEWSGPQNVRYAIEQLGAQRIGHGVPALEDAAVVELARTRGVVFEVCVTSNVQSGVYPRFIDHPLKSMIDMNLRATLNTDDPSVSNITLTDEMQMTAASLGMGMDYLKQMTLTAAEAGFLPKGEREKLVAKFTAEFSKL